MRGDEISAAGFRIMAPNRPNEIRGPLRNVTMDRAGCPEDLGLLKLREFDGAVFPRNYASGQSIISAGEEPAFFGAIVEGLVSLSKLTSDGRRQIVGLMSPLNFIGRPSCETAPNDVIALTQVRLCLIARKRFENALETVPGLRERFLQMSLDQLDAAREWMLVLARKSSREKVATLVAMLCMRGPSVQGMGMPEDGFSFELPLTRAAMADFLGTTTETVSRQIGELRRAGVIEVTDARQLRILSFARLVEIAGEDVVADMPVPLHGPAYAPALART